MTMTPGTAFTAFTSSCTLEQKWDVLQGDVPLLLVRERSVRELSSLTTTATDSPGNEAYFEFPARSHHIRAVRRAAGATAKRLGFEDVPRDGIMLAVGEAVNNAVRYSIANAGDKAEAYVRVWILPSHDLMRPGLHVTVVNPGPFNPVTAPSREMPAAEAMIEGGRGFPLMSLLMDKVTVSQWRGQTIVRLWKALEPENTR